MGFIGDLWLAIVLSAAAAWFWCFLSWAALDLHRGDFKGVPDEERLTALLREMNLPPEYYSFPFARGAAKKDPAFAAKWKAGPLGILQVWSPKISMPKNMLLSYLVNLAVSFLMAYVGSLALPHGSSFLQVMQVMGTVGVLSYAFAFLPGMVWFQGPPRVAAVAVVDGVVQGLAVGLVFAAMWPGA